MPALIVGLINARGLVFSDSHLVHLTPSRAIGIYARHVTAWNANGFSSPVIDKIGQKHMAAEKSFAHDTRTKDKHCIPLSKRRGIRAPASWIRNRLSS